MTMTRDYTSKTTRRNALRTIGTLGAIGAIPGAAAAQEAPTPKTTETPTPEGEEVVVQIDPTTKLSGWEYDGATFSLEFEADTPTVLKITDSGAVMEAWEGGGSGGGAVSIPTEGYTLSSGKTTVEFAATKYEGAGAISVATSNGTAFVFSEAIDRGGVSVELSTAMAGGAAAAVGSGALSYRKTKAALEDDEEPNAERIA